MHNPTQTEAPPHAPFRVLQLCPFSPSLHHSVAPSLPRSVSLSLRPTERRTDRATRGQIQTPSPQRCSPSPSAAPVPPPPPIALAHPLSSPDDPRRLQCH